MRFCLKLWLWFVCQTKTFFHAAAWNPLAAQRLQTWERTQITRDLVVPAKFQVPQRPQGFLSKLAAAPIPCQRKAKSKIGHPNTMAMSTNTWTWSGAQSMQHKSNYEKNKTNHTKTAKPALKLELTTTHLAIPQLTDANNKASLRASNLF